MKILFFLLVLMTQYSALAEDLSVVIEGDDTNTKVVATPLAEAPKDIPGLAYRKENKERPPKWWKITLLGLGLAPIEFFISTVQHESMHGVAAESFGADVTAFHPWPHQHEGLPFRIGDTHWSGYLSPNKRALTLAAPMFLNTAVLGTYGGMVLTDSLPKNRYAQLSVWVFAVGHWVDLANHIIGKHSKTDTQRIEKFFRDEHGLSTNQSRLAVRGSQALVLAAGGYFLYKGFRKIFKGTHYNEVDLNYANYARSDDGSSTRKKKKKKNSDYYLAPSMNEEGGGLVFGGRF